MFFYKNDIKNGLSNEGLKKLVFVEGLGSTYEKCEREAKIVAYLANILDLKEKDLLQRTVMLSKADLMSDDFDSVADNWFVVGIHHYYHQTES